MTIAPSLMRAIEAVVADAGGDGDDAADLAATWERMARGQVALVARMRYEVATARCCCADGGDEPTSDGRCRRCWRRL